MHGQLREHLNLSRLHSAHDTVCLELVALRFEEEDAEPMIVDEGPATSLGETECGGSILAEVEGIAVD